MANGAALLCAALAGVLAGAVRAGAAPPQSAGVVSLRYDVRWGRLRLFTLESETHLGDARVYRMAVTIRTSGVAGWFVDWTSRSETSGILAHGALQPTYRTARAEYGGQRHTVTMTYGASGPAHVAVEPDPSSDGLEPVADGLRDATIDPETATLAMIRRNAVGHPCTGVERVFDGRLRYDLHLVDGGTELLELRGEVPYAGEARLCDTTVRPVAGYPAKEPEKWGAGMRLRYWLAPVLAGAMPVPARIDLHGAAGTLRADLAEARVAVAGDG